jgi:hypothetical protein
MKKYVIFLFSLALLSACNKENTASFEGPYYPLNAAIDSVWQQLDSTHLLVEKTIRLNQNKETQLVPLSSLKEDLELLRQMDINKPAWTTSYAVSKMTKHSGVEYTYSSKDDKLPVKELRITLNRQQQLDNVYALRKTKNMLYALEQEIYWDCDSFIEVHSAQRVTLLEDKNHHIFSCLVRK